MRFLKLAVLASVVALAINNSVVLAQAGFSWFDNQIIKNSTSTIPARKTYVYEFVVHESARVRIDVKSEANAELDSYLLTSGDYQAWSRSGTGSKWIENIEGSTAQFFHVLSPGKYNLMVTNEQSFTQNVHIRVWLQRQ